MTDEIPPIDPEFAQQYRSDTQEALELSLLRSEAQNQELKRKDSGQRRIIRWIAVVMGVVVIAGMATVLTHLVHQTFLGPFHFVSPSFAVAMIVAPITSITAITVALFYGAFRKFDDKDLEAMGNGAAGLANVFRGS